MKELQACDVHVDRFLEGSPCFKSTMHLIQYHWPIITLLLSARRVETMANLITALRQEMSVHCFYWHILYCQQALWQESKTTQMSFWAKPLKLRYGRVPGIHILLGDEIQVAYWWASPAQTLPPARRQKSWLKLPRLEDLSYYLQNAEDGQAFICK